MKFFTRAKHTKIPDGQDKPWVDPEKYRTDIVKEVRDPDEKTPLSQQPIKLHKMGASIWTGYTENSPLLLSRVDGSESLERRALDEYRKLSGKHQKMPSLKDLEGSEPVDLVRSPALMDFSIK